MNLTGTGGLVTGGSGAIGTAVVDEFARAGMDVTVGYRTDAEAAEAAVEAARDHGVRAQAVGADLTDPDEADRLVRRADDFADLRVVVNGAGLADPHPIEEVSPGALERSLAANVETATNVSRAAIPRLREADPVDGSAGAVVNLSSVAAEIGTVDTTYATAKAGLLGFTRALAREVGEDGVRVNAVCPGAVDTPMNDAVVEYLESRRFRGHRTVDTLLGRYEAQPAEIATAVRFLAAHDFVTGEVLHVDGGMSL